MTLLVDRMQPSVLRSIAQNMGWEGDGAVPSEYLKQIAELDANDAFEKWCTWEGFLGCPARLMDVIDDIRRADGENEHMRFTIEEGGILKNWVGEYLDDARTGDVTQETAHQMNRLAKKFKAL